MVEVPERWPKISRQVNGEDEILDAGSVVETAVVKV